MLWTKETSPSLMTSRLTAATKCSLPHITSAIVLFQVTLPQLAALHHNNCMYIAHHLLTLGHQFRPKLPEPLNQGVASFVDLVPVIRQMGEKCFLEQLVSNCFFFHNGNGNISIYRMYHTVSWRFATVCGFFNIPQGYEH